MKAFFNTTGQSGEALAQATSKAISQTDIVKDLFKESMFAMSGSEVYRILLKRNLIHPAVPITSIRRAITVLKKEGYLQRSTELKKGIYGAQEHYYQKAI